MPFSLRQLSACKDSKTELKNMEESDSPFVLNLVNVAPQSKSASRTSLSAAMDDDKESVKEEGEIGDASSQAGRNLSINQPGTNEMNAKSPTLDGGWHAWAVVAGGFLTMFLSFGFLNNFGVFQTFYVHHTLKGQSNSKVAWIGAMQTFCILAANLIIGPLFDRFGPRPLLLASMFLFVFGAMMTSLAKEYWQILLTQGIVLGTSLGAAFITPIACTMHWFDKKRPAALGLVISGSSIGGVVWPVITSRLLDSVGFQWTWRILGFIGLALFPIAILSLHNPPHMRSTARARPSRALLAPEAFRHRPYATFVGLYCLFGFAFFPLLFFFPQLAALHGADEDLQLYTVSIINALSFCSRLGLPIVAQKTGVYNTAIFSVTMCIIVAFAAMGIDSVAGTLIAAGAYGFSSGGALSLLVACMPFCVSDFSKLGAAMGQVLFASSFFGMLSGPIAGWILATKQGGNWIGVEAFVGASYVCVLVPLVLIRHWLQPDWRKAR